jgi:hypothetical protein
VYEKMRGWMEMQATAAEPLPEGPVLLRPVGDVAPELHEQWKGTFVAVVADASLARRLSDRGVKTCLIGAAAAPAPLMRIDSWAEFAKRLKDLL